MPYEKARALNFAPGEKPSPMGLAVVEPWPPHLLEPRVPAYAIPAVESTMPKYRLGATHGPAARREPKQIQL